ncbi:hypothetical protein [Thaumasiovibrio subtropicus]|uniref:hypothetical protein n=1 Tax=Thaumasiovibrio subtropicus TaxID=1891207 RepID=UPI000B354E37|nr:hypothetical protein [Thaumasiovibrio subtropicus]
MARITKAERDKNKNTFDAIILNIFLSEGWDAVTLTRLSQETGFKKSTLQGYYPTRNDMGDALTFKMLPCVYAELDFSTPTTFLESWNSSLKHNGVFRSVLRVLFTSSLSVGAEQAMRSGMQHLVNRCRRELGETGEQAIVDVLGGSLVMLCESESLLKGH